MLPPQRASVRQWGAGHWGLLWGPLRNEVAPEPWQTPTSSIAQQVVLAWLCLLLNTSFVEMGAKRLLSLSQAGR